MNNIGNRAKKLKYLLLLAAAILFYYGVTQSSLVHHYLQNPTILKEVILDFGILAPLALILLQAFQTTISIIPSQLTTVIAGFIFGPVWGLAYSLIGAFFGSALIFFISKKYGKRIALKLFEKKDLVHFNLFFRQRKGWALFLARITPIFPNDVVSFTAGLTSIKFWQFNLISTLGFFIQMAILVLFGAGMIGGKFNVPVLIFSAVVVLFIFIVIFRDRIRKTIIRDIHKLEKEGLIIEKAIEREFRRI